MKPFTPALSWLIDEAADVDGADRFLGELGARLVAEGLPIVGGALVLEVAHPLIARRTWLWRADSGEVIEAPGFASAEFMGPKAHPHNDAAKRWLAGLAQGIAHEAVVGNKPNGPWLAWIGPRGFASEEADRLALAARAASAPLAALSARATLASSLEAYLGRRSAAQALAAPLRRVVGETIEAALLFADLRGFTSLSEAQPPALVLAALDAWFDRIAGAVHAYGGEVLKFMGDGALAIFPVAGATPRTACASAVRAVVAARAGMARLNEERLRHSLPPLKFGAALHFGEMFWGNIGAANRLDFTAIGPAVNLVSRLEGLCKPLGRSALVSGALAAQVDTPLVSLGAHALRGTAAPCEVFALPEN